MAEYITDHWKQVFRKLLEEAETNAPTTNQDPTLPKEPEQAGNASETEILIVIVILCIFSVVGTLGNGLVLYVFTRTPAKMASTIFILALAGTDFVTCLVIIPYTVTAIRLEYNLQFDILCKTYQFLITCTVPLSAFIMVAIAVDRYICICHPFAHVMTVRRAKIIVGILTLFATVLGLITALGYSVYQMERLNSTSTIPPQYEIINGTSNESITETFNFQQDHKYHIRDDDEADKPIRMHKVYIGLCDQSKVLYSANFISVYQKIYSAFYLCSLMIVLILYGLIYSSVTKQRAKRRAQKMGGRVKQVNTHCQTDECTIPLTNVKSKSKVNSNHNNISLKVEMDGETTTTRLMPDEQTNGVKDAENKIVKNSSIRKPGAQDHTKDRKDHDRLANIKTAVMLFIVTIVFIVAFLPAWLMAHRWITFYNVIFYMYFVYNVANPVIYAFMNQMFRDNMCKIFNSCRNVATRP
ncbi:uncharacterized protein LOC132723112 [Ruditapes philippinarum]|uniref:uncharacterized protein LOC132723112 n=1 Tax=Ruditapes philippinarum TaxID=129788 RepID=UPI00295AA519|nr:uncharacterized protein LOC132723112 [Ruditapes philippinarum]